MESLDDTPGDNKFEVAEQSETDPQFITTQRISYVRGLFPESMKAAELGVMVTIPGFAETWSGTIRNGLWRFQDQFRQFHYYFKGLAIEVACE
jgi:hypothetical protein